MGRPRSMHVSVDPRGELSTCNFVLKALLSAGCAIRFERLDAPSHSLGMAISSGGRRIWIDARDGGGMDSAPAEWADVYAKVNIEPGIVDVVPLGPLFGLQLWSLPAGYLKLVALVRGGAHPRKALAHLRFQGITRLPIEDYVPGSSEPDFVFLRSRFWTGKHSAVNASRARFLRSLEGMDLRIDAEFASERIDLATFLEHTRRSAVVFNAPAVHQCLGWKLGEFLALGKAIISVPLNRELPMPLVHGEHIHFIADDVDAMREAVALITRDDAYRRRLEVGARRWFDEVLSPVSVAQRVLGAELRAEP